MFGYISSFILSGRILNKFNNMINWIFLMKNIIYLDGNFKPYFSSLGSWLSACCYVVFAMSRHVCFGLNSFSSEIFREFKNSLLFFFRRSLSWFIHGFNVQIFYVSQRSERELCMTANLEGELRPAWIMAFRWQKRVRKRKKAKN